MTPRIQLSRAADSELSKEALLEVLESYVTSIARTVAQETVSKALDGYEEPEHTRATSGISPSPKAKSGRIRLTPTTAKVGMKAIAKSGNSYLPVVIVSFFDDPEEGRLFKLDRLDKHTIPPGVKSALSPKPLASLFAYNEADIYYPPTKPQPKKADKVRRLSSASQR